MFNSIRNYGEAFSTTVGYSSVWKKIFFYLETEWFLPIIILDIYLAKSDWNWWVLLKTGVWEILSAFAQMSKAIGDVSTSQCFWGYRYTWNWVSYYDDDATISLKLKAVAAFEQSLWEKSRASGKRNKTWEEGTGKESESSLFPRPLTA